MRAEVFVVSTVLVTAMHVRSELLKVVAHQLIETLMSSCVLHKASLIAEAVEAIFATAVKMRLVVSVAAVWEVAILIESKLKVTVGN